jgi:ribose transport system substrate-binding protein
MMNGTWIFKRATMMALVVSAVAVLGLWAAGGNAKGKSTATSSATVAAASNGLARAKADVKAVSKPPTSLGVALDRLKKRVPKNSTLILMQCGAPICKEFGDRIADAAKALGVKFSRLDTGATPDSISRAFTQAVRLKPDALISVSLPTALYKSQLNALIKGGTKVVLHLTPGTPEKGVAGRAFGPKNIGLQGKRLANWVTADSNGNGKAVLVNTPEFNALNSLNSQFGRELKRNCAKCSWSGLQVKAAEIGGVIPGRVVSFLQGHPDVKYVVLQFGDLGVGLPEALNGAGISGVRIISAAGSAVNRAYVKEGKQAADLTSFLPNQAWQEVDQVAHALAGQKVKEPTSQMQWLTKKNIKDPKQYPPMGINYKAEFKKLWRVS